MKKILICNNCGHAHFSISEVEALNQANQVKKYIDSLSEEKKKEYLNGQDYDVLKEVERQKFCFRCNESNKNFHEQTEKDFVPIGATIQSIIPYSLKS